MFLVPTALLLQSGGVKHILKRPHRVEDALDLAKFTDIAPRIGRMRDVGPQGEANLVQAVREVDGHDVMAATQEIAHQAAADGAQPPGHKNPHHHTPRLCMRNDPASCPPAPSGAARRGRVGRETYARTSCFATPIHGLPS
jgi:hypothetical protein